MKRKCVYGIIGSGWRAEFYMRIAQALPQLFEVCGVVSRSEEKRTVIQKNFGCQVYGTPEELLHSARPDFVVVSVNGAVACEVTAPLVKKGIPVLAETPPAKDLEGLKQLNRLAGTGGRIQVAEQYHLQPMYQAALSMIHSGKLGECRYVHVSFSHGYHAVSMIRKALGIGFENAVIQAHRFTFPRVEGFSRMGLPEEEILKANDHVFAFLDFGGKVGFYDFEANQHRSWARSQRVMARGERGEINNDSIKYLKDYKTPVELNLKRMQAGEGTNLEGYHLKGILAGEDWIYVNPFLPAGLSDEEIAVATCLMKMREYVNGGSEFYSLAEASQDQYLAMMMQQAVETGGRIVTETQEWARPFRSTGLPGESPAEGR